MSPAIRGNKQGRYIVHVWNVYCGCVHRRHGFDTAGGARRFAERESANEETREVSVTGTPTADGDGFNDWGPRLIVARNGSIVYDIVAA